MRSANVSQTDWCFDATTRPPGGILSSPRQLTRVPTTTRNSHSEERAHAFATSRNAARGMASVGSTAIIQTIRLA